MSFNFSYPSNPAPLQCSSNNQRASFSNLSTEHLYRMHCLNSVFISQLPPNLCNEQILTSNQWFGKFGKINQIKIYFDFNYGSASIIYCNKMSSVKAQNTLNSYKLFDGNTLKVTAGIYCCYFFNGTKCPYRKCRFIHQMTINSDEDSKENINEIESSMIENQLKLKGLCQKWIEKETSVVECNMKGEIFRLKNELVICKKSEKQLRIKNVELETKYNALNNKYNMLTKNMCGKANNYLSWNWIDIFEWIDKKNKYKKYNHILCQRLSKENMNGVDLHHINEMDLHKIGITDMNDKISLLNDIKQLINNSEFNAIEGEHTFDILHGESSFE